MQSLFKTTSFLSVLWLLVSCTASKSPPAESVVGEYNYTGIYGVGSTINLKANHTFEFTWQTGLIFGTTTGIWKKKGSRLLLHSDLQPDPTAKGYELVRTQKLPSDSLLVRLVESEGYGLWLANCWLTKEGEVLEGAAADENGMVRLPKLEADSIHVSYLEYRDINHPYDPSLSFMTFKMEEEKACYEFFTNEIWRFRKGRLYDPSIKRHRYAKKRYYERSN